MNYCRNCGSELSDEVKFCTNCGTPVDILDTEDNKGVEKRTNAIDKYGWLYGIILMILAILSLTIESAAFMIVASIAILVASIFCLAKKYKLKGFTIVALILAVICLLVGIDQAKDSKSHRNSKKVKTNEKKIEKTIDEITAVKELESVEELETVEEQKATEEQKAIEEQIVEEKPTVEEEKTVQEEKLEESVTSEETASEDSKTVVGVNPELKAFLDSYEEFMDEYVEFMENYASNPSNVVSMLSEYSEMLEKSLEFAEKAEEYESEELSTADTLYYIEVMNRINMKLLDFN